MNNKIKLCKDCKWCCPSNKRNKIDIFAKCSHPECLSKPEYLLVIGEDKKEDRRLYCSSVRTWYCGGGYWLWKWGCGPRGNLWEAKDER